MRFLEIQSLPKNDFFERFLGRIVSLFSHFLRASQSLVVGVVSDVVWWT